MEVSITILALNALNQRNYSQPWLAGSPCGIDVILRMGCHWRRIQQTLDIFNTHLIHHVCSYLHLTLFISQDWKYFAWYTYHTGQLSVELSKSKVPSAWQAMLKVDFDRSDSQKRVGLPSTFAPCNLLSVLDLGNIFVVLFGPIYAPVLCIGIRNSPLLYLNTCCL